MRYIGIGDGHDGAANISGGGNIVNSYAACTGTVNTKTVTTALSVSVGDYVLLHQSRKSPSGAGAWEMVKVEATGSGNFTADRSLANTYVTGAQAVLVPQYTSGTINGTLTGTAWNGTIGGIVVLYFFSYSLAIWYLIKKYNERVISNKNSNTSPNKF